MPCLKYIFPTMSVHIKTGHKFECLQQESSIWNLDGLFFSRLEKETFKKGISTELFLFWEARVTFKHCNNVLYYVWIPRQFKRFSKRKHCNHQNFGSYFLFTPNADPKKIRAYFKRPNGSPYSCDSFDPSPHFVSELS